MFTKDKLRAQYALRHVKELITEDIYIVFDISACVWEPLVTEYEGRYASDELRRRLRGVRFCETHSAMPTIFNIPPEYFVRFLKKEPWPRWEPQDWTSYPRDRFDAEYDQLVIASEMVKRGMVLASDLNARVEELARNDEDLFYEEAIFYRAD